MTPQLYLEFDSDSDLKRWEEWAGRMYSLASDQPYPLPPDSWPGPGAPPDSLNTYLYLSGVRKPSGGGVVKLDDEILSFATTAPQTLTAGIQYAYDIPANQKTIAQLTEEGRTVVTPRLP